MVITLRQDSKTWSRPGIESTFLGSPALNLEMRCPRNCKWATHLNSKASWLTAQLVSVSVLGLSRHRPLLTDLKVPCHYQKACQWSVTIDSAHFTIHVVISTSSNLGFHSDTTQDRLVGMATSYTLDDPGIESRWGTRFSIPVQTGSGDHPASFTVGIGCFTFMGTCIVNVFKHNQQDTTLHNGMWK